jgi:hypothetical protein
MYLARSGGKETRRGEKSRAKKGRREASTLELGEDFSGIR